MVFFEEEKMSCTIGPIDKKEKGHYKKIAIIIVENN